MFRVFEKTLNRICNPEVCSTPCKGSWVILTWCCSTKFTLKYLNTWNVELHQLRVKHCHFRVLIITASEISKFLSFYVLPELFGTSSRLSRLIPKRKPHSKSRPQAFFYPCLPLPLRILPHADLKSDRGTELEVCCFSSLCGTNLTIYVSFEFIYRLWNQTKLLPWYACSSIGYFGGI